MQYSLLLAFDIRQFSTTGRRIFELSIVIESEPEPELTFAVPIYNCIRPYAAFSRTSCDSNITYLLVKHLIPPSRFNYNYWPCIFRDGIGNRPFDRLGRGPRALAVDASSNGNGHLTFMCLHLCLLTKLFRQKRPSQLAKCQLVVCSCEMVGSLPRLATGRTSYETYVEFKWFSAFFDRVRTLNAL